MRIKHSLIFGTLLLSANLCLAQQPSFSTGSARVTNPGLIDCGGRSRISAVGEVKSEDSPLWVVPAKTHFESDSKASDLWSSNLVLDNLVLVRARMQ